MDYSSMADHYDLVMTSGYYDYPAIAKRLARHGGAGSVLEIGAGTGLILDDLAERRPDLHLVGVDLTQAMLDIAHERLWRHPRAHGSRRPGIELARQNVVELDLPHRFDLAYSYGGPWYFVRGNGPHTGRTSNNDADDPEGPAGTAGEIAAVGSEGEEWFLVSHLRDDADNRRGLERVAAHLNRAGIFLLGVQGPHTDYDKPLAGELTYSQHISEIPDGFRKQYRLARAGWTVMQQTTDYRTYSFAEAIDLLDAAGFEHHDGSDESAGRGGPLFLEFSLR